MIKFKSSIKGNEVGIRIKPVTIEGEVFNVLAIVDFKNETGSETVETDLAIFTGPVRAEIFEMVLKDFKKAETFTVCDEMNDERTKGVNHGN